MAPLTRYRADINHVHSNGLAAKYYEQRASVPGTLLITEATYISPRASGYEHVPSIHNAAQIAAWRKVTDKVRAKGSHIFLQIWALGRVANPEVIKKEGYDVVSASAIASGADHVVPRALTEEEIEDFIQDFAQAAKNAVEAGFDGVEIHGANGYLVNQFIEDVSNLRTDKWGGSIENRSRFALEIIKATTQAVGAEKVAIRLSPYSTFQGMKMKDPIPQYTYLINELRKFDLAYLHLVDSRMGSAAGETLEFALEAWDNKAPVLIAGGLEAETARKTLDVEYKNYDVVAVFGRHFIANPDLVYRIREGLELNKYDRDTFYNAESPRGYVDYPFYSELVREEKSVLDKVESSTPLVASA